MKLVAGALLAGSAGAVCAAPQIPAAAVIPLWPEGVPDAKPELGPEHVDGGHTSNVGEPTLTVYGPAVDRPNGTAVIICPGGGYVRLSMQREGEQYEEEGCLSLPEIRDKVKRAAKVKVRAQNVNGEWFEIEGEELLARALQHEIDHLDGILFIDRLSRLKKDLTVRRIKKMIKNGEW